MEFSAETTFNRYMGVFRTSSFKLRLMAGTVLMAFMIQSAQASFCGELDLESKSIAEMTAPGSMPCHEDGSGLGQDGSCCLSCVAMMLPNQDFVADLSTGNTEVFRLTVFQLPTRADLLYRPPN